MQRKLLLLKIPDFLFEIIRKIEAGGFSSYIVGGAVRDVVLGKDPEDWDLVSDALPADIIKMFSRVINVGIKHGTVSVLKGKHQVEVSTFKTEGTTPQTLEEDLRHRDLTINAMAYSPTMDKLIDPWGGLRDLNRGIIRAVEDPFLRFEEDRLRAFRAVRFAAQFGFKIDELTQDAITYFASSLKDVAIERIRNEFLKLLMSKVPSDGLDLLRKLEITQNILPEILEGEKITQNRFHRFDIYWHSLKTVDYLPSDPLLRWIGLFHDIAKPRVKQEQNKMVHFYGHAYASAKLTKDIMERWRFSKKEILKAEKLIENHMLHDFDKWKPSAFRRLIIRVGPENIKDLLLLFKADRLAHGVEKKDQIERNVEILRDRIYQASPRNPVLTTKDLAIGGKEIMDILDITPGPTVGNVLKNLLDIVIEGRCKNTVGELTSIVKKTKKH